MKYEKEVKELRAQLIDVISDFAESVPIMIGALSMLDDVDDESDIEKMTRLLGEFTQALKEFSQRMDSIMLGAEDEN